MPATFSLLQSAAYTKDAVPAQALLRFVLALSRVAHGQQAILKVSIKLVKAFLFLPSCGALISPH